MFSAKWLIAGFLALHVTALMVAAVPAGALIPDRLEPSGVPPGGSATSLGASPLDRLGAAVLETTRVLSRMLQPVRPLAEFYRNTIGFAGHWQMFSRPPRTAQYVRVRYYIGRDGPQGESPQVQWTAFELITPAHREDRVRLLESLADSSLDKAVMVGLEEFYRRRTAGGILQNPKSGDLPTELAPVGRYFAQRFASRYLVSGERLLRTDVWYGTAPVSPLGVPGEADRRLARWEVLQPYFDGPIEERSGGTAYPPYQALHVEGDIRWVLEYFE